jgi:UPF0716 family protein affecting phage T7 exclusion
MFIYHYFLMNFGFCPTLLFFGVTGVTGVILLKTKELTRLHNQNVKCNRVTEHPDAKSSNDKMVAINRAYETLTQGGR